MSDKSEMQPRKSSMTPLWVISLFLTLTETMLGVGVIQTSGGIQVALTVFVLVFPLLVACAFFGILWFKPYVFYTPYEFGSAADAATFIDAISRDAKTIHEKVTQVASAAEQIEALRLELENKAKELEEKIAKAKNEAVALSMFMS
jgi:uncharacterized protein YbaP (TraB family)